MKLIPFNKRLLVSFPDEKKEIEELSLAKSFGVDNSKKPIGDSLVILDVEHVGEELEYSNFTNFKQVLVPRHMIETFKLDGKEYHFVEYRTIVAGVK